MKNTLISLCVGFLVGRHIYINYDKKQARQKETQIKNRLVETLKELGLSTREVNTQSQRILRR